MQKCLPNWNDVCRSLPNPEASAILPGMRTCICSCTLILLLGGCAPEVKTARTYELSETGQVSTLASCTIHASAEVAVAVPGDFDKETGALIGGIVGGLFGAAVDVADGDSGIGAGAYAGAAAGVLAGGAAGAALQTRLVPGVRYVYRTGSEEQLQAVVFPLRGGEAIMPSGTDCLVESYPYDPYCHQRTGDARRCGGGRAQRWARLLPLTEGSRIRSAPELEYE